MPANALVVVADVCVTLTLMLLNRAAALHVERDRRADARVRRLAAKVGKDVERLCPVPATLQLCVDQMFVPRPPAKSPAPAAEPTEVRRRPPPPPRPPRRRARGERF